MRNKKKSIIFAVILITLSLWISGIIPKQIAKISATNYLKKNFPKMQLEYVDIEWSSSFGGYSIRFKDENNKMHSFIMNNKYFPITLGQGLFGFEEEYKKKYESQNVNKENLEGAFNAKIKQISEYNGKTTVLIEGLESNDINHRGEFDFSIDNDTELLWGETKIEISKLKEGQNVSITSSGEVLERYPAKLTKVTKIVVLDIFDIGNRIEEIISNANQTSSNPYDYINANRREYQELLEHPKETFEYSIKDLVDTNANNGLKSYIEVILCSEINKNFEYDFKSANDYLEKYKEFLNKSDSILNEYDTYAKSVFN